jgi:hypothetical protein
MGKILLIVLILLLIGAFPGWGYRPGWRPFGGLGLVLLIVLILVLLGKI